MSFHPRLRMVAGDNLYHLRSSVAPLMWYPFIPELGFGQTQNPLIQMFHHFC